LYWYEVLGMKIMAVIMALVVDDEEEEDFMG